ncbi:MAG: oligosaccharide flippase family protein [Patescibacteria group bacterium]
MSGYIKDKIAYFRQHWFVKNLAVLQVGNFSNTFIQGLTGIIIARLLQPELFGIYAISFSLAGLLVLVVSFGIQDTGAALVGGTYARENHQGTKEAFLFLGRLASVIAVLSVVAILVAPSLAGKIYHNPLIGWYAGILVMASFISNTFLSFSALAYQVVGKIKQMTLLTFADQTLRNILAVLLVAAGLSITGAMSGHLLGAVAMLVVSVIAWERLRKNHSMFPSFREFFTQSSNLQVRKHISFSAWVALDKNIATLFNLLPVLMVALYVSTTEVTYFKISLAYVNLVLGLMGPISTLLNVELPRMQSEDPAMLKKNFIRVSLYSLLCSIALTAGALVVSPIALRILYGSSFTPGVKYIIGLGIYGAFLGLGIGLGSMWRALRKVKISILINTITLAVGIPVGLYLIKHFEVWGAVIMVSLWFTISHCVSFIYLIKKLK